MIRITPLGYIINNGLDPEILLKKLQDSSDLFSLDETIGRFEFFMSGKDAIRAIIKHLGLVRQDEVFITTTTNTSYVSTCVSATIFNFCKISRVLTEKTRAIFVIHTYGFPHPELLKLRIMADNLKVPLIEDGISAFNSYNNSNIRLGSVGDYAIYSLPKIIPIEYGGILTSKTNNIKGVSDDYLAAKLNLWSPLINVLKKNSRDNYFFLKKKIGSPVYLEDLNVNPYMYGFISDKYNKVMEELSGLIEFGKTHVEYEVHIPVNPFVQIKDYEYLLDFLKK